MKYYINPTELRLEVATSIDNGKPTDRLVAMFRTMCVHIMNSREFQRNKEPYRSAMYERAMFKFSKFYDRFDLESDSSPFSYFTVLIRNAFKDMKDPSL